MTKQNQIEQMARITCQMYCRQYEKRCAGVAECDYKCLHYQRCEALYDAGYHKQSEWISVEDRLPDELFTSVLIYCPDKDNIYCAYLNARNEWHIFDQGSGLWVLERVTHWMPLPAPPTEKEN